MCSVNVQESNLQKQPPSFEAIKKSYQKPMVTVLDFMDIATGSANVPENTNGVLGS